jgi:hypothetical protein
MAGMQQITWLDLLAANMAGFLWIWAVSSALRWWKTEQSKFIPGFLLVAFVGFGLLIFTIRAQYWFDQIDDAPAVIVPSVAKQ